MTVYSSKEKDYVRQNLWIPITTQVARRNGVAKILEMVGETKLPWWKNIKIKSIGVTLNNSSNSHNYEQVFVGWIGKLLKTVRFKKQFPFQIINLDYYGGGRWFSDRYRYPKLEEVFEIISLNLEKTDEFTLLLTVDVNDLIFPWYQVGKNVILDSSCFLSIDRFILKSSSPDYRSIWLALIGVPFELNRFCFSQRIDCKLIDSPYTYIGESQKHVTRMLTFAFKLTQNHSTKSNKNSYKNILKYVKKSHFVKWDSIGKKIYEQKSL